LVLVEGTGPERRIDITFGLTDGWWRFADTDVRSAYSLLTPERWLELLRDAGFTEAAVAPADAEAHRQAILLARTPAQRTPEQGSWLIFGGAAVGKRLAMRLQAAGARCVLVSDLAPNAIATHLAAAAEAGESLRGIIHLAALDAEDLAGPGTLEPAQRRVCGSVLELVQALGRMSIAPPHLWLATRGAQPVGASERLAVAQAPLWGLATILRTEHPELHCCTVDLDPAADADEQAAALLAELLAGESEDRVALRQGRRYVARLVRSRIEPAAGGASAPVVRLQGAPSGVLEEMKWIPAVRRPPGRGEVEIRVHATGLNFRDVMNALAMREDRDPLGGECSGRIVAVGEDVEGFEPGDEVVAIATGGFGTYVTVSADLVLRTPPSLGLAEAAGQPLAFLTAHYCLNHLARLAAGERILIHAAAGGVGLAAVRLAQKAGAEIFATAGSEEKHEYLRSLGIRHVYDSRSLCFVDGVLQATDGRGVDVVLNSLAGEFIPRSLDSLAEDGRFLEIGKRDIWTAAQVAQRKPGVHYHVVDLASRLHAAPASVAPILREAMEGVMSGAVEPLPVTTFPGERVADAFRYMAQAKHIGKVVVVQDAVAQMPAGTVAPRADASYLVTGGLAGLGLLSARWLAERGAGTVV
ncbi:MAG TPA: zinc-binding dehydrogenase, partial [Longimicrobiaceae bacterium]|nr:zinc-binding dehydrogenase [Longimicrobiaceae bacterium]